MKAIVYHRGYGCDTGCCGHAVVLVPDNEVVDDKWPYYDNEKFHLMEHPENNRDEIREYVQAVVTKEFGEEHVKDIDWAHCFVNNGCDWND